MGSTTGVAGTRRALLSTAAGVTVVPHSASAQQAHADLVLAQASLPPRDLIAPADARPAYPAHPPSAWPDLQQMLERARKVDAYSETWGDATRRFEEAYQHFFPKRPAAGADAGAAPPNFFSAGVNGRIEIPSVDRNLHPAPEPPSAAVKLPPN